MLNLIYDIKNVFKKCNELDRVKKEQFEAWKDQAIVRAYYEKSNRLFWYAEMNYRIACSSCTSCNQEQHQRCIRIWKYYIDWSEYYRHRITGESKPTFTISISDSYEPSYEGPQWIFNYVNDQVFELKPKG